MARRILLILTSADKALDGAQTGYYLPEAAHPYYSFKEANYDIEFAAPKGPNPPVDNYSVETFGKDEECAKFLSDPEVKAKLAGTKKLADVKVENFDAIFYVGGHGPVIDLASDVTNANFASEFYQTGKLVAAVCHGPAALVNVKDASGKSIFAGGRKFTGFSNDEEHQAHKVNAVPFLLEDKLASLGGVYESGEAWKPYVTIDRTLYTGQNPASAKPLADTVVKALG